MFINIILNLYVINYLCFGVAGCENQMITITHAGGKVLVILCIPIQLVIYYAACIIHVLFHYLQVVNLVYLYSN